MLNAFKGWSRQPYVLIPCHFLHSRKISCSNCSMSAYDLIPCQAMYNYCPSKGAGKVGGSSTYTSPSLIILVCKLYNSFNRMVLLIVHTLMGALPYPCWGRRGKPPPINNPQFLYPPLSLVVSARLISFLRA